MDNHPEAQSALKRVTLGITVGIGLLAVDGALIAWDLQDKVVDIHAAYHAPIVISGLTLVIAAGLHWLELRGNREHPGP